MKFTWCGKENAIIESMTPSTGTLRPDKESSKNWDDTENLYIEGDNLEVLKLLQKSYFGKVKMIYIDPPYNTGKDFVYKDNFRDNIANYKEITSQTTKANPETNGRYHTDWLNMMYPRLKMARNLLKEDGLIFVSIDDNELDNLKKVMDEIFGEMNFMGRIMPIVNPGGRDYKQIAVTNEYLLVYSKSDLSMIREISKDIKFKFSDSLGGYELRDLRNRNPKFHSGNRPNLFYPFYVNSNIKDKYGFYSVSLSKGNGYDIEVKPYNSEGKESVWRWGVSKSKENIDLNNIEKSQVVAKQKNDGGWIILEKNRRCTTKIKSIWDGNEMRTEEGTRSIRNLFGFTPFDHTKPVGFIKRILEISDNSGIILDFFSGSSTTAHAIMELNAINNSNLKYIMIQIPEAINNNSEVYKRGYKNICQIGKDRIRKVGDKIVEENKDKEGIENLDIGFKVFKLEYNCGGENSAMMEEGIKVDIIKRPKDKPICKFKVDGELYYLVKTNEDIIVFPYKSSIKGKAIASIFNIELCKNKDYMQLEYLYNMKLNEFNGEDFAHSQYVTSVILDNVYKNLNE